MGLCKCPKKKVTNQFCFEHKVNVCEYCMTAGHHQICIVGPYLQWLENSSFDPTCYLCKTDLSTHQCVRLCCYHICHMDCLDRHFSQMPSNTAPAGYTCPVCGVPIFSFGSATKMSPVATLLEQTLSNYSWASFGIGMSLGESSHSTNYESFNGSLGVSNGSTMGGSEPSLENSTSISMPSHVNESFAPKILHNLSNKMNYSSTPIPVNSMTSYISTNNDLSFGSTSSMRSKFDNESRRALLSTVDEIAEDKYRTKSPIEFVSRWLRSQSSYMKNQSTVSGLGIYKKFIIYGIVVLFILLFLIRYFVKYGRQSAEGDPLLNPMLDPNLRNEDSM